MSIWEDSIILRSKKETFKNRGPVSDYLNQETNIDPNELKLPKPIEYYVKNDPYPIPAVEDREMYCPDHDYEFWLSGLYDFKKISDAAKRQKIRLNKDTRVLDFGCASGRVLRHFAAQSKAQVWGSDISDDHVTWCNKYLSKKMVVFQNTSIPNMPIEDNFFDIIYAMSVFTHIESFETSWLCEVRRMLKPGGIAYITVHDESAWERMPKEWGVGKALLQHPDFDRKWLKTGFPGEKFVSRWHEDKSYSSNVFYKMEYIKKVWGKFFDIKEVIPGGSAYQTVLILQKP